MFILLYFIFYIIWFLSAGLRKSFDTWDSVAVIIRPDTNIGMRGRTSFVLIGCERSGQYKTKKKDLVRTDTDSRKCGYPFKLCISLCFVLVLF